MFKKPTLLILGAGASAEFLMPIGSRLMTQVAEAVQFDSAETDPRFRERMEKFLDAQQIARLVAVGPRLLSLIPKFDSMDEVLHFLSNDGDAVELGKIAIAYQILKSERNSLLFHAIAGNPDAISQCDSTWVNKFLRIAISATRRQDFKNFFDNLTVVDFNYDRVFPNICTHHFSACTAYPN